MYAVTATVERTRGDWNSVLQVPTFYLDERAQGIVNEGHALRIALDIIDPWGDHGGDVHVTVVKL